MYTCRSVLQWGLVHGRAVKQTVHDFRSSSSSSSSSFWQPSLTPSQMLLVHTEQTLVKATLAQHHKHQQHSRSPSSASPSFSFSRAFFSRAPAAPHHRHRLRLGYMSYSFGSGTRNGLLTEVLGRHFRGKIEVFAYALRPHDGSDDAAKRTEIERNFEHWVDVSGFGSFGDIAQLVNGDGVQVLADLCGLHSNGSNVYAIFERQPAPVQVMSC
jgi:predicted O-linked N-acetylglucosamine transferase (SPINDLY family)